VFGSSPTGQFSMPKRVQTGNAGNATGRYGDYFAVAIDPLNQQNVWVAGEVGGHNGSGQNGWGTAVGQISVTP